MKNQRRSVSLILLLSFGLIQIPTIDASPPDEQTGFPVTLAGDLVRMSSVAFGDLDGDELPEIVVGGSDGMVYAYHGTGALFWSYDTSPETGGAAIESKAAIADIDLDGDVEVVIGAGSTFTPGTDGRLFVFDSQGNRECYFDPGLLEQNRGGVYSSPAVADLDQNDDGKLEIIFGAWDHKVWALHHDCSVYWGAFVMDTVWSSPAIGDLDGNGSLEVVIGGDAHYNAPPNGMERGGRLHVFNSDGSYRPGFPIQIDEVIFSSPALGDLDGDDYLDIVVGTGNCWGATSGCGDIYIPGVGEEIHAWDRDGVPLPGWPRAVPGQYPGGSPTLADIDEDGKLEVVINTASRETTSEGYVYVLNEDGTDVPGWPVQPVVPRDCDANTDRYPTNASPVVGDINGDQHLEILLHCGADIVVWDYQGNQLSRDVYGPGSCQPADPETYQLIAFLNFSGPTPGIVDLDGDTDLEVVVGGAITFPPVQGGLWAWDFPGATSGAVPWPVFRRSQDNTALVPAGVVFINGFEEGDETGWSDTLGFPEPQFVNSRSPGPW